MTKYSKSKSSSTSNCFTNIFQRLICTRNLPTHPSPPDQIVENPEIIQSFSRPCPLTNVNGPVVSARAHANSPGIVARLMGLDSLPNYENVTTLDSLFRSKSLNSLHFMPDFDPTRAAFHRRARTSASFHEQGQSRNFYVTKDDNLKSDMKQIKKGGREKKAVSKAKNNETRQGDGRIKVSGSKKRYEERYSRRIRRSKDSVGGNGVSSHDLKEKCGLHKKKSLNNKERLIGKVVGSTVSSKRKVDHKEDMCIEVQSDDILLSRSPVSVLDHHTKDISPFSKVDGRQITSDSRRKSTPKLKICDNLAQELVPKSKESYQQYCNKIASEQELVKAEVEAADYLVEMLGNICKLAEEEHKKDFKWVTMYEILKVHFVEEMSIHLGQQMLDFLLDELLDEIMSL